MSIRMDYDLSDETDLSVRATAYIRPKEGRFFKAGGLWIYDNEIDRVEGSFEDGDILTVRDFDGYFLGYGFINRRSAIRIRMLSRHEEEKITNAFLSGRVRAAWEYRKKVIDTSSCRVVFGEADFLPGITIDKYEDILVIESLALGTDRLKGLILEALCTVLAADGIQIRGIYERSDAKVREKEGLPRTCGFLTAPFDTKVKIRENGVQYYVDVENGQKTGFFLDQKENRKAIWRLCPGADVLDFFTHTGSFGLNAAMAGAAHVLSVDSSALAIEQAKENAALNGLSESSSIRPPSPNHAVQSGPPCAATAKSTCAACGSPETAASSSPAPVPTSWIPNSSGKQSAKPPMTRMCDSARWNSAPRRRTIRSCGIPRNLTI